MGEGETKEVRVNGATWMSDNLEDWKNLYLFQIAFPGSHDSGMAKSTYNWSTKTTFGFPNTTVTQVHDIYGQLECGIRVLDVRPVIKHGQYLSGHCTQVDQLQDNAIFQGEKWQGACGESIESLVNAVNNFTSRFNELIVLRVADWCGFNADAGFRDFTADEWKGFWKILQRLEKLYIAPQKDKILRDDKLGTYLQKGKPAVFVIVTGDRQINSMDDIHGKGFYKYDQWLQSHVTHYFSEELSTLEYVAQTAGAVITSRGPTSHWDYPLIDQAEGNFTNKAIVNAAQYRDRIPTGKAWNIYLPASLLWADGIDGTVFASMCWLWTKFAADTIKNNKLT